MKDWKGMAKAAGSNIPSRDLEQVAATLGALEEAFRPLVEGLTPDVEPATEFRIGDDE